MNAGILAVVVILLVHTSLQNTYEPVVIAGDTITLATNDTKQLIIGEDGIVAITKAVQFTPPASNDHSMPCDESHRGVLNFIRGGTGQADEFQVCIRNAQGQYEWLDGAHQVQQCPSGLVMTGIQANGSIICVAKPNISGSCLSGQVMTGISSTGSIICSTPPSIAGNCPTGQVMTGIGSNGELTCTSLSGLVIGGACANVTTCLYQWGAGSCKSSQGCTQGATHLSYYGGPADKCWLCLS